MSTLVWLYDKLKSNHVFLVSQEVPGQQGSYQIHTAETAKGLTSRIIYGGKPKGSTRIDNFRSMNSADRYADAIVDRLSKDPNVVTLVRLDSMVPGIKAPPEFEAFFTGQPISSSTLKYGQQEAPAWWTYGAQQVAQDWLKVGHQPIGKAGSLDEAISLMEKEEAVGAVPATPRPRPVPKPVPVAVTGQTPVQQAAQDITSALKNPAPIPYTPPAQKARQEAIHDFNPTRQWIKVPRN